MELINSDFVLRHIVGSESFFSSHPDLEGHAKAVKTTAKVISSISSFSTNDQVVAVAEIKTYDLSDLDQSKTTLALDGIADPGNLGTIIRTLDWFGLDQLFLSSSSVDVYNPKTVSATMGSFTRIKVAQGDLPGFCRNFKGVKVGAQMTGDSPKRLSMRQEPILLVMGSESHGISSPVLEMLDYSVTIPRIGRAESLNVGIATGILCHEMVSKNS